MDPTLFKAARDGNVEALLKLVEGDPLILERIATTSADTPMHVAAMLGHLDFVKELIKHKSNIVEYVKELNQHGFSPMHMACANGHVEVVRELLLEITIELCSVKGKDGMIPLHCASIKGRVETISQLLEASLGTVSEVTATSETALHLAVKNNQLDALEILVHMLKKNNMLEIVNYKDDQGNTVLHLAAARRNHQVLELLLSCNSLHPGVLQLNAVNESGLTALDIVLCPCDFGHGYADIERLLRCVGAERARVVKDISPAPPNAHSQVPTQSVTRNVAPSRTVRPKKLRQEEILRWEDYFKFQFDKSTPDRVRNILLVVAVLMATATFQAGLSPPGGVRGDGPRRGEALLASNRISFFIFMFCNSAGFYVSMHTILILTYRFPMYWELYAATMGIVFTYDTSVITFSPPGRIRVFFIFISVVLPFAIPLISHNIRRWSILRAKRRTRIRPSTNNDQATNA